MACCVCGLRQAWGKPGSTGDIIDEKTTRLGITPSPLFTRSPFISQLSMNSSLYFSFLLTSLPLHLCPVIQHHLPLFLPHRPIISPSALLSQTFLNLNSFLHRHVHCLPSIYLAFSQTDGLLVTQHIYPCKREYVRSALHMLRLNSTFSLSRESH